LLRLRWFTASNSNPPYSISKWDYDFWEKDPFGRNSFGKVPRGRADYAFIQHIIASMDENSGRSAILLPHGILFRDAEHESRKKLIESDKIEAVIGLGPNLFYNASMESCILVLNNKKSEERQNKILFINANNEITRQAAFSFLSNENIRKIYDLYEQYTAIDNSSYVSNIDEIKNNNYHLNILFYVKNKSDLTYSESTEIISEWSDDSHKISESLTDMIHILKESISRENDFKK